MGDVPFFRLAWLFPDDLSLASFSLHPNLDAVRQCVEKWMRDTHLDRQKEEQEVFAYPRAGLGNSVMIQSVFMDPESSFGKLIDASLEHAGKTRENFISLFVHSGDASEMWHGIRGLRGGHPFEHPYTPPHYTAPIVTLTPKPPAGPTARNRLRFSRLPQPEDQS